MVRDDFLKGVVVVVAQRAGYFCSNPKCKKPTVKPHSDPNNRYILGKACHIYAASPGGPRYNKNQTEEKRKSISNAIWLCNDCSEIIDKDTVKYPAELLFRWKEEHETWIKNEGMVPSLPLIEVCTSSGLPIPEQPGITITAEMLNVYHHHVLRITNMNKIDLLNILAQIQLPEPIVRNSKIEKPAGIEVIWEPDCPQLVFHGTGSGSVTRLGKRRPTGIYNLKIEKLPPTSKIQIGFLTYNGPEAEVYIDSFKPLHEEENPNWIKIYIDGSFQYLCRNQYLTNTFFVPLKFDQNERKIESLPVQGDYGKYIPRQLTLLT